MSVAALIFLPADRSPLRSLFGRPFQSSTPLPDSHSSSDSSTESESSSYNDSPYPSVHEDEDDIMASMDAEDWGADW